MLKKFKKETKKELDPLRGKLWFSPMFEKPTKVKLPCIVLAFTAVVNKKRLMEI